MTANVSSATAAPPKHQHTRAGDLPIVGSPPPASDAPNKPKGKTAYKPLMERIVESEKLSANQKELSVLTSFMGVALPVAKVLGFGLKKVELGNLTTSILTSLGALSSMHLVNRGNKQLDKLALIGGGAAGVIAIQEYIPMPRFVPRSLIATAVFLAEKYKPDPVLEHKHDHHHHDGEVCTDSSHDHSHETKNESKHGHHHHDGETCNHPHHNHSEGVKNEGKHEHHHHHDSEACAHPDHNHSHETKNESKHDHHHHEGEVCTHPEHNHATENSKKTFQPGDWKRFWKIQALILSVPSIVKIPVHKVEEMADDASSITSQLLGHTGATTLQVLGLVGGFFGGGKGLDYLSDKFGKKDSTHKHDHKHEHEGKEVGQVQAGAEVCGHCGVPGCVDSVTEGVAESSQSSITQLFEDPTETCMEKVNELISMMF